MKKVSNINCTFFNDYGLCEAKESTCFAKECLLVGEQFSECSVRLKYNRLMGHSHFPAPPPARNITGCEQPERPFNIPSPRPMCKARNK